jgi:hypothetical protein
MLRTFLAPGGNRTAASSLAASTIARASQGWLTQRETRAGPTTPRDAPAKIYLHGRWASVRLELAMSRRTWIGLALLCVVIWLVADSQGPDLLAFNAHGTFLTVLQIAWVLSLFGFILLVALGVFYLVRSRVSRTRPSP